LCVLFSFTSSEVFFSGFRSQFLVRFVELPHVCSGFILFVTVLIIDSDP
jgi:hypothetical protein